MAMMMMMAGICTKDLLLPPASSSQPASILTCNVPTRRVCRRAQMQSVEPLPVVNDSHFCPQVRQPSPSLCVCVCVCLSLSLHVCGRELEMMLQWRKWYHHHDEALLLKMQVRGGEQSLIGFVLDFLLPLRMPGSGKGLESSLLIVVL